MKAEEADLNSFDLIINATGEEALGHYLTRTATDSGILSRLYRFGLMVPESQYERCFGTLLKQHVLAAFPTPIEPRFIP